MTISAAMPSGATTAPIPRTGVPQRIELIRLAMIVGIMVIHIPYTAAHNPYAPGRDALDWTMLFLRDGLFRAGVPTLSIISGWLLARQTRRSYPDLLKKKAGTLLIPFFVFNVGTFAAVYLMQVAGAGSFWPDVVGASAGETADFALALSSQPINVPLYFLRDLMVCMLLSPVLFLMLRRAPWIGLGVLFLVTIVGPQVPGWGDVQTTIILRIDILLFLYIGMMLGDSEVDLTKLDAYLVPALLLSLLGAGVTMVLGALDMPFGTTVQRLLIIPMKGAICVTVWIISARIIEFPLGQFLARNSGKAFWFFCTHIPVMTVLFMIWHRTAIPYPVFYVSVVPVTIMVLVAVYYSARNVAPDLFALATGKRAKKKPVMQMA